MEKKLWTYGNAIAKYPVTVGSVWSVGGATFVCGDLEGDQTVLRGQLDKIKPDLMYVDPPWDDKIATDFRVKSGLDEKHREVDVSTVIRAVLKLAKDLRVLALMEGGHKRRELNRRCAEAVGSKVAAEWTITYTQKAVPCALFAVDFRDEPKADWPDFNGLSELQTEELSLRHYKPRVVFDPCGGLGGTAEAAAYVGTQSLSHELSPYKMAAAIKRLAKFTGQKPIQIQ